MNHKTLIEEIFNYYSRSHSSLILSVWESYLTKHLNLEEIKQACYLVITEEKFLPTPQEVVEKVKGNTQQQALKTWYELVTCEGKYSSFSPEIRRILTKIGHIHLMKKSDLPQAKRDFLELYHLERRTQSNPETLSYNDSPKNIPSNSSTIKRLEQFNAGFGR